MEFIDKLPPRKKKYNLNFQAANDWSKAFELNKYLLHVDISHNNIDAKEFQIINEGLDKNHTILGIHAYGNEGTIDSLGFFNQHDLDGLVDVQDVAKNVIFSRIQLNLQTGIKKNLCQIRLQATSNCWICEGWSQFNFQFSPSQPIDVNIIPVKLHLSCDNYKGEIMQFDEESSKKENEKNIQNNLKSLIETQTVKQTFSVIRMIPPGTLYYYFTINDEKQYLNEDQKQIDSFNAVNEAQNLLNLQVPKTNIIKNIIQNRQVVDRMYLANMNCVPRPIPVILKGRIKIKTPWDFFQSVFKSYKPDNQNIIDDCFEIDWENTKCQKFIRGEGEADKIKKYIKTIYKSIRETYKYYAGVSPLGRIMSIGSSTLNELLGKCNNFIDQKTIKTSDVDLSLIACNGGNRTNNWLSPDKALVRCQLIEVLVRLSIDKYVKTKICQTASQAVQLAFQQNFLPLFETFDCHNWRKERLWREEIDILFSRFLVYLEMTFKAYSGKYPNPGGNQQYMSLEEFIKLLSDSSLINEHFGNREAGPLWNLSMMTNKNELSTEKHLQMQMVEFFEAISRVADKYELIHLKDYFPEYVSKNPYHLDKKLECIFFQIMKNRLPEKVFQNALTKYNTIIMKELENLQKGIETQFKRND